MTRAAFAGLLGLIAASAASAQEEPDPVPYIPTAPVVVDAMLRLAEVGPADVLYDLGSGDGRIPITAARRSGTRGVGYEIDAELVRRSRDAARAAGVDTLVRFVTEDLFLADLTPASVVTLYLSPALNLRLRSKLLRELAPVARVVSHAFHMGDWEADDVVHVGEGAARATVYLWVIPADLDGFWELALETGGGARGFALEIRQSRQMVTGSLRRGGVEAARVTGRMRGDEVELIVHDVRAGEIGLVERGRLTGRLRDGVLVGTHRRPDGRAEGWRAERFSP